MRKFFVLFIFLFFILSDFSFSQSGKEYRKTGLHNGNRVKATFGNWGVIGQPASAGRRGSWIYDNNGYVGDVSLFVGAEVKDPATGKIFHSVVTCPVDRPTKLADESPTGKKWTFEPVTGYDNPKQQSIAISTDENSWPSYWPDKMDDPSDPGWRGSWNGYFGKRPNADQESIFVMDDNNDERFNYANNNAYGVAFKPDARNPQRNGLGLEVKVRGLQWAQFLAQDNIFWLYEIKNTGTYNYDKMVFGMLVGTYVGCTSTENSGEYDDDWSFFDVLRDLTFTGDFDKNCSRNPNWVGPVGMVGYAFLESPGNPYDGIDNDRDSYKTGRTPKAPYFTAKDFDSITIKAGDTLIIIDTNYVRSKVVVSSTPQVYKTRGFSLYIEPGKTKICEGNMVKDINGREIVNPNAYDGVDNDFDGLIDENYQLHYRQVRKDKSGITLFDILNPTTYINYKTGYGLSEQMIDEKRDDNIDNDGDWNPLYDDVGADGVANTGDYGEGDGMPTHGEPNFDETDVDESDQIGLTSFQYFAPANDISLGNDEDLWSRLAPGYFDVPKSIVNGKPEYGEDGDFIYGSGYFPLLAGKTERLSLALVYGGGLSTRDQDIEDLLKHRETVQKIYNSNYRFPQAPDKPTLTAVPGDGMVTLYWDRKAEQSFDPVLKEFDFEGYKIYRATDPNFNDVNKITDANGVVVGYIPLAQFDLIDSIKGYFRANDQLFQDTKGFSFYLGSDNGLQHTYIDYNVENGRKYYYALVAYDKGNPALDILPSENTKFISILPNGEIKTDINTAVVIPNTNKAGYVPPPSSILLNKVSSIGTGSIYYKVVDPTVLENTTYEVSFDDTRTKGEYIPITTTYSVKDLTRRTETFTPSDTIFVKLKHSYLIGNSIQVFDENGSAVPSSNYVVDTLRGRIKASKAGSLPGKSYKISFLYYPVFQSPYIVGSPFVSEAKDADNFDGLQLYFNNDWTVRLNDTLSGWNTGSRQYNFTFSTLNIEDPPLKASRYPSDYEIRFADNIIDTSSSLYDAMPIPVNFTVINVTDNQRVEFLFSDNNNDGKLSSLDQLYFFEKDPITKQYKYTWVMNFTVPVGQKDTTYTFKNGDVLKIFTTKPFRKGDIWKFTVKPAELNVQKASEELNKVKVVPNPYISAHTHEAPLPPGITSGRGERRIDFIHVPPNSTIDIFTSRGEHVITLHSDNSVFNGCVSWNLKSKENLDVAYGIYFYILDSPYGKKDGKIAIIK
jgi:hypothetical protein